MSRTITKQDKKIAELVKEYKGLAVDINNKVDEITEKEEERNKIALQIQKIKDKLSPLTEKITEGEIGEFETITNVQVNDNGDIEIDIADAVEEFKIAFKKKGEKPAEEVVSPYVEEENKG